MRFVLLPLYTAFDGSAEADDILNFSPYLPLIDGID